MAVYAGARRGDTATMPRRRQPTVVRAHRRTNPFGVALAAILTSFLLGLFYLTQTIHVAASGYAMDGLQSDLERLNRQAQSLRGEVARWGAEPQIVDSAHQAGLSRLGEPVRLKP